MSITVSYVLGEHRRRAFSTFRTLGLLALVIAIAFFLASFWPAREFAATAALENARFDVDVNGPLRKIDIARIGRQLPATAETVCVYSGNLTEIKAKGNTIDGSPAVLYPPESAENILLTYLSPELITDGSMTAPGAAAIDVLTAKMLGVGIGDVLAYEQRVDANSAHNLHGSAKITAIFAPANEMQGVVVPLPAELGKALAGPGRVVGSDLFIQTGGASPNDIAGRLATFRASANWTITVVEDQLALARRDVEGAASRAVRITMIVGSLLIYAIYALRDEFSRVERRKKAVAIMASLGEPVTRISVVFAAEQAVLALTATVLGIAVASYATSTYLHLYVPSDAMLVLATLAVAVNAAIILAVAVYLRYRVARMPIATILSTE